MGWKSVFVVQVVRGRRRIGQPQGNYRPPTLAGQLPQARTTIARRLLCSCFSSCLSLLCAFCFPAVVVAVLAAGGRETSWRTPDSLKVDRSSLRSANGAPPCKAAHQSLGFTPVHAPRHSALDPRTIADNFLLCVCPRHCTDPALYRLPTARHLRTPQQLQGFDPVRRPALTGFPRPTHEHTQSNKRALQQYWRLSGNTREPAATGSPRRSSSQWPRDRKYERP